jgi:hypothetical protein
MAIAFNEQAVSPTALSMRRADTRQHENLITDALLTRALEAILEEACTSGQMRARRMREKANLTLCEAVQVLLYLQRQEVLQEAVDGVRIVNLALARDYLSILAPREQALSGEAPEERHPFTRPQIAWGCIHAREGKLTQMRLARPSRWTIGLARALGLVLSDTPGALLFPTSRAKRLCDLVTGMSEQDRAPYIRWAESQLPADEKAEGGKSAV